MNSNLNLSVIQADVQAIRKRQSEIRYLKKINAETKEIVRREKANAIESMLADFIEDMRHSDLHDKYIEGCYTSEFTRHVNRNGGLFSLSNRHYQAQEAFNKALRELNGVFVDDIMALSPLDCVRLSNSWGLKKLV